MFQLPVDVGQAFYPQTLMVGIFVITRIMSFLNLTNKFALNTGLGEVALGETYL